ncbi:MAG TPA: tRNA 2-selenouridine(34) synthase MnmH [Flavitalea sp.]|nr:tRNA 2-selenouridine(34) synthase MnmH [Flavitalea sp.]
MGVQKINITEFLDLARNHPVLDVRSPGEYSHAHIPGAYSFPLFSDDERKMVGTTYKQQSREAAMKIGLDFFGPKMRGMVEQVESLIDCRRQMLDKKSTATEQRPSAIVLVHCWRGGMRSAAVAWLLDLYGFKVFTLTGGYKSYRNHVLKTFDSSYDIKIIGGYTGSGKTIILKELEKKGEKVIDLEGIACHKGSAFGAIGQPAQPSQEMFENILAHELATQSTIDEDAASHVIWLEDESQRIGLINIPQPFWEKMRLSPVYFVDIPFEQRLDYVVECYGKLDKEKMVNSIIRIRKRLGGLETKSAINYLLEDDSKESFRILLKYYDKYYLKGLNNRINGRELIKTITSEKIDASGNAEKVLKHSASLMVAKFSL